jgi:hypothetical protein
LPVPGGPYRSCCRDRPVRARAPGCGTWRHRWGCPCCRSARPTC